MQFGGPISDFWCPIFGGISLLLKRSKMTDASIPSFTYSTLDIWQGSECSSAYYSRDFSEKLVIDFHIFYFRNQVFSKGTSI